MLPGIICTHVAEKKAPAGVMVHDAPQHEQDSGFVLLCGEGHTWPNDLRIVDLDRYLDEPDLQQLRATLHEGYRAARTAPGQPWVVEPIPQDEAA